MTAQLQLTKKALLLLIAAVLAFASLVPLLASRAASADQLTSRSATIDKSYASATDVEYAFSFEIPTATEVEGIRLQWCTTPLGTCTAPTGTGFTVASATVDGQATWDGATAFADGGSADENNCTEATNSTREVCLERTDTTSENDTVARTITLSGINHTDTEQSIYVRIDLYSNNTFQTVDLVHYGVVAVAIVDQITVTARVQERLVFCVGTANAESDLAQPDPEDCSDITGTTEDLGAVDFLAVCTNATNPCDNNGAGLGGSGGTTEDGSFALVATNAQEGVSISYYAEDDTTGGAADHLPALRIPGADCDATEPSTSVVDQCFNSAGWDGTSDVDGVLIIAGTESFGMTVAGTTAPDNIDGSLGLTANLARTAEYDGNGATGAGTCTAADAGTNQPCWAWNESGVADIIATSSDVLDFEGLDIRFAATASLTTPTGTYSVTSTYVATPTF